jgi:hypothetical protein
MLSRIVALASVFASGAAVVLGGEVKSFTVSDMQPGSRFEIAAGDHVYRGELVDPTTGETRLAASTDGVQFSQPRTVYLLGATQGRQAEAGGLMLVKMHQVQTGLCLEVGLGSLDEHDRAVTEPVRSIHMN